MKRLLLCTIALLKFTASEASGDSVYSFRYREDVTITIDRPAIISKYPAKLIIYALPNGNTTAQTMGKRIQEGDDWHFDIQHIRAQTAFVRQTDTTSVYIVAYLENDLKSWPAWTNRHSGQQLTAAIIDTIENILDIPLTGIHLASHSGGGAFVFDFIKQQGHIPAKIKRITFLDSDYRYDSTYTEPLRKFAEEDVSHCLNVFAYNDSIALLNGKTFVSPTGGTWYRTKLMLRHLSPYFSFKQLEKGDLTWYHCQKTGAINIFLLENPDKKILHTKQVELNGFIHAVFVGTPFANKGYVYMGERAYERFIRN